MNILTSCIIENPRGATEECAQFTIDEIATPFKMHDVVVVGKKYTLGFWIKSEETGSIEVCGLEMQTTPEWKRHVVKFTATSSILEILFNSNGTYYMHNTKLENGDKDTTWTPAPEDMATGEDVKNAQEEINESLDETNERVSVSETLIQQLSDSISHLVVDENGASLMTQTENGWSFSMAETTEAVNSVSENLEALMKETGSTQATVEMLQQAMEDTAAKLDYVNIGSYEEEPCIELGESENDFKLMITNKRIMFRVGSDIPTLINTKGLVTENIEVKGEIVQGGFVQVITSGGG